MIYFQRLFLLSILFCLTSLVCQANDYKLQKVVIDAGHGGKDPGALGKKSKEKDITLSIALKVGKYITDNLPDVEVIYTRTKDEFVELHKRAEIANKNKADLFISIHVNANANPRAYGTDSWVMGIHKSEENLEVAKLENQVILVEEDYSAQYQGLDPNATESYIIFNLMQNTFLEQSLSFASLTQSQFKNRVGRKDRGVKAAPFLVLWNTAMPSVLIETGFITNPNEEKFLNTDDGQSYMASAIYRAFKEYKATLERKTQFAQHTGIRYHIQLLSSSQKVDPASFELDIEVDEVKTDNLYKYIVGNAPTYDEIVTLKNKIKTKFPESFVIALKNGNSIPLQEAIAETDK